MKRTKSFMMALTAILSLAILILDTKTAIAGAQKGIEQSIRVILPSLFPFFLVSGIFCQSIQQFNLRLLSPLCEFSKMPAGTEPLLIVGLLGGYPVGAKEITAMYKSGAISRIDAERLLGFCSNAGPSFIFGIVALQFTNKLVGLWLFIIQILAAIITGRLLPGETNNTKINKPKIKINIITIFDNAIRSVTSVCGWVILFRIIISFIERWILWIFPQTASVIITGILELANGCTQLSLIENDGLRMIIGSAILSHGGLCVYLQTVSVTEKLGTGMYFPGKLIQCCISIFLSGILQYFLFDRNNHIPILYPALPFVLMIMIMHFIKLKKSVAIPQKVMYNL